MLDVNLTRQQGDFRLDVAFSVEPRGVFALYGPSGAGKTSLIHMIAGLKRPDQGRVILNDVVFCDTARGIFLPPHLRHVGVVFQACLLFPHLNVRGNLRYGAGRNPAGANISFDHVVEVLGIADLLQRPVHALSGGEQQRVALGRALLSQPRLLLMDEPLASLDMARRGEIMKLFEQVRDQFAIPMIYVSHAVEEIIRLADNMAVIAGGGIAAIGAPEEVFSRPDLPAISGQPDAGAVIHATVLRHDPQYGLSALSFPGGELWAPQVPLPAGGRLRLRILARDVTLALSRQEDSSVLNIFPGVIAGIGEAHGPYVEVQVDIGAPILARLTVKSLQRLALAPGRRVFAMIKAVAISARADPG